MRTHVSSYIDADAHVIESVGTFSYIDIKNNDLRPVIVTRTDSTVEKDPKGRPQKEYWLIDGKIQQKEGNVGTYTSKESRELTNVSARLKDMDDLNIQIQVIYPTLFLAALTQNHEVEYALCRSYNHFLADAWSQSDNRVRWVLIPPLLQMNKVEEQIQFGKENGACGIFMRGLECEKSATDPYFFPLFDLAQKYDLPICFHAGNNSFKVRNIYAKNKSGFSRAKWPAIGALHNLILEDIPKKWPNVRWGFVELSSQWLPFALNDVKVRFNKRDIAFSETILEDNNIFVACEATDDFDWVLKYVGENVLVTGTDFGHADSSTDTDVFSKLKAVPEIAPQLLKKIVHDNPIKLYGL